MPERQGHDWSEAALVDALRSIQADVAWPAPGPTGTGHDLAASVRARIESLPVASAAPGWSRSRPTLPARSWLVRPAWRAALIAVALLIAIAAAAGAAGIDLPGLRILFGTGPVSPPPSAAPSQPPSSAGPGAVMRLGDPVSLADRTTLDGQAGFHVMLPTDPSAGLPAAGFIDETKAGQVSLVWPARDGLPATLEPGVGLVLTEFRGSVDEAYFGKVVGTGTTVEPVLINGRRGYWLSGEPHFFFYSGPRGVIQDDRRWVGDALVWSDGDLTYRLESALGRDATIRIAESMR